MKNTTFEIWCPFAIDNLHVGFHLQYDLSSYKFFRFRIDLLIIAMIIYFEW